jgi:hypothetical protein
MPAVLPRFIRVAVWRNRFCRRLTLRLRNSSDIELFNGFVQNNLLLAKWLETTADKEAEEDDDE